MVAIQFEIIFRIHSFHTNKKYRSSNVCASIFCFLNEFRIIMSMFEDLGKATRRGIKKCIKCGIYNGTKSIACKNKDCDMIFKDSSEKRKVISDAIQLMTGNLRKLFSVRVRDQRPDYRGFVQLPLIHHLNASSSSSQFSEVALCFVDNCPRLFQNSISLQYCNNDVALWDTANSCPHISASGRCKIMATPLPLKPHIILKMKASKDIKEKLWTIANENNIPVVQKVSKTVMVVKCQVTPKHPLGYLHFTFNTGRSREECGSHFCDCSEIVPTPKCIHFYLCICALASDSRYVQEFSSFVETEFEENRAFTNLNTKIINKNSHYASKALSSIECETKIIKSKKKKLKKGTKLTIGRKIWPKIYPIQINILNQNTKESDPGNCQETNPIWTFNNWLSFVVESMNKLIVFENAGTLNSLVFNIPWEFYRALRSKIPKEYLRPIADSLDYEVIHIMNIGHVKQTFDNSKVKLKVSKRFVLSENSTYEEIDENDESTGDLMPHFIYFLNVGQLTVDDSDNTNNSFTIEWVFKSSNTNVGQLKLQYKYGRKCL
ncbi:hypothetical protein HHI36_007237 [Cryptolaemus montrouzieri]|uniref:Putative treble-clef zinc-finger domain-containing protein n=1 Tax=Cryptolaemus montrouzieri TaxID=559131 RepID=A0ABD2MP30_9CUCU